MSTRDTVEELLRRMASGNAETTAELFAEEVDSVCAGSEKVPWIRPRRTRKDMADFFGTMNASFVPGTGRRLCLDSSSMGRMPW
jgi:hypothetical protein